MIFKTIYCFSYYLPSVVWTFWNPYFQALLFNDGRYVFFSHLSLPHYHKALGFRTLRTSSTSLKLIIRQWESATVEKPVYGRSGVQCAMYDRWLGVFAALQTIYKFCYILVIVFVAIHSLISCLSLGYARYTFFLYKLWSFVMIQ